MRNFQNTFETCKRSFISAFCEKKQQFFNVFSQINFCSFTVKNTPRCSFKYFESSDVIVVKKKSSLS